MINKLSNEMKKRIEIMALKTWGVIGADILRIVEEQGGNPIILQNEVVDAVCDASYMQMYGNDEEAYTLWNSLPIDIQENVVKKAFPAARYGW